MFFWEVASVEVDSSGRIVTDRFVVEDKLVREGRASAFHR